MRREVWTPLNTGLITCLLFQLVYLAGLDPSTESKADIRCLASTLKICHCFRGDRRPWQHCQNSCRGLGQKKGLLISLASTRRLLYCCKLKKHAPKVAVPYEGSYKSYALACNQGCGGAWPHGLSQRILQHLQSRSPKEGSPIPKDSLVKRRHSMEL